MLKEEKEVLPLLAQHCSVEEQRQLFWNTIRDRLLERMLPWVVSQVSEEQCTEMLYTMRMAGAAAGEPEISGVLVQLLVQWAQRGRDSLDRQGHRHKRIRLSGIGGNQSVPDVAEASKQPSLSSPDTVCAPALALSDHDSVPSPIPPYKVVNPIDHIFQFHKALRHEVKRLESDAQLLSRHVEEGLKSDNSLQQLEGRFQFLKGIYIAHSEVEDRIVFPALERKEVLRNVSHAYSLEHQKEHEMFLQVEELVARLKEKKEDDAELRSLTSRLRVTCAAVRANLEMHVRAEETELWPLFNEHFSVSEQEEIVGSIIGNTGAEVLQTMITWVAKETDAEEQAVMMEALRSATRNTRFDKWLASIITSEAEEEAPDEQARRTKASGRYLRAWPTSRGSWRRRAGLRRRSLSSAPAGRTSSSSTSSSSRAPCAASPTTQASTRTARPTSSRTSWPPGTSWRSSAA
uniref:Zinc finger protein n=1 Tax=Tetraselmis sp. GSL018 TaxID=582737 RepID=A0A061SFV9_9CHLO